MPNLTTNFSFNKPLVNDATDEDLWGGYLNDNWDSVDGILPIFAASEFGAVIVQSTDDAGMETLPEGTANQILQSNGADALPTWETRAASTTVAGLVEKATQAEMESPTADKYPDAVLLNNHPGVAKAWVSFDGTAVDGAADLTGVNASHNITSVVDNGTGSYTVAFTTNFSSANWVGQLTISAGATEITHNYFGGIVDKAAGSCRIDIEGGGGANIDAVIVDAVFYGDQ